MQILHEHNAVQWVQWHAWSRNAHKLCRVAQDSTQSVQGQARTDMPCVGFIKFAAWLPLAVGPAASEAASSLSWSASKLLPSSTGPAAEAAAAAPIAPGPGTPEPAFSGMSMTQVSLQMLKLAIHPCRQLVEVRSKMTAIQKGSCATMHPHVENTIQHSSISKEDELAFARA